MGVEANGHNGSRQGEIIPLRNVTLFDAVDGLFREAAPNHTPGEVLAAVLRWAHPDMQVSVTISTAKPADKAEKPALVPLFTREILPISQEEIDASNAKTARRLKLILSPNNDARVIFNNRISAIIRNADGIESLPEEIQTVVRQALEDPRFKGFTLKDLGNIAESKASQPYERGRYNTVTGYADRIKRTHPERFPQPEIALKNSEGKIEIPTGAVALTEGVPVELGMHSTNGQSDVGIGADEITINDPRFSKLSKDHRKFAELAIRGLTAREIAKELGYALSSTYNLLSREIYSRVPELRSVMLKAKTPSLSTSVAKPHATREEGKVGSISLQEALAKVTSIKHKQIIEGLFAGQSNDEMATLVGTTTGYINVMLSSQIYKRVPELKLLRQGSKSVKPKIGTEGMLLEPRIRLGDVRISQLPKEYRTIVEMRLTGMTDDEIAEILMTSVTTVQDNFAQFVIPYIPELQ